MTAQKHDSAKGTTFHGGAANALDALDKIAAEISRRYTRIGIYHESSSPAFKSDLENLRIIRAALQSASAQRLDALAATPSAQVPADNDRLDKAIGALKRIEWGQTKKAFEWANSEQLRDMARDTLKDLGVEGYD